MGFTPREEFIVQHYLIEAKSFAEVRRLLNAREKERERGGVHVSATRLRQIIAKVGRKAAHYSKHFDVTHTKRSIIETLIVGHIVVHRPERFSYRQICDALKLDGIRSGVSEALEYLTARGLIVKGYGAMGEEWWTGRDSQINELPANADSLATVEDE
jgi:hypothetical protein